MDLQILREEGGGSMIKQTVCVYCSYRYDYRTEQEESYCPICGAHNYTRDLVPCKSIEQEDEE